MKPITIQRRVQLERELGFAVCPLTIEIEGDLARSILADDREQKNRYKCAKDYGSARGGRQSALVYGVAVTPCSMEYAANCPIYKTHRHLVAVVYPYLGEPTPAQAEGL